MKDFVAEIKNRYSDRFVIFDSPPVLPFAESGLLAHLVDAILFVVREKGVSSENVHESLETIKGTEVLGFIYNDALIHRLDDRYKYYRGYYK
jgi:Mrp family chromosome partitioning ATPase